MKQSISTSQTNSKLTKKPLLPTFRQAKTSSRVQQLSSINKQEIFINTKLLPLQVIAERKNGEIVKIVLNSTDIVVQDQGKSYKSFSNISSSADLHGQKQWLELNFGEYFHSIKVKKIGDQNIFGGSSSMVSWQSDQNIQKKIGTVINLRDIMKVQQKTSQNVNLNVNIPKQDQTKQMKAFVANLMSRKLNRKATEKSEGQSKFQSKISVRKRSQILKSKPHSNLQQNDRDSAQTKLINISQNTGSTLSAINGPKSLRKEFFEKNLKESKFTGKSQRQTSVGDQSLFMNQRLHANVNQLSTVQNDDYERKKLKFDSQPYFYQKSTITSQFSNHNESTQKYINQSRQQKPSVQISNLKIQNPQTTQNLAQCLLNRSQHKSQQQQAQVQQDIKRSGLVNSSLRHQDQGLSRSKIKKQKRVQQSSECVESHEIQSSGTIYESKYE